jgi:hypothetical protein
MPSIGALPGQPGRPMTGNGAGRSTARSRLHPGDTLSPRKPARREEDTGMDTLTEPPATANRHGSIRFRPAGYWLATAAVAAELAVGGVWDIARLPFVRDLVTHLGYPSYFLVLLGIWKVLAAAALIVPRRPLLKEWAYAGAFFTYTGAIASHLTTGYALGEVGLLAVLTALTVLSWALRPPSRRTPRRGEP